MAHDIGRADLLRLGATFLALFAVYMLFSETPSATEMIAGAVCAVFATLMMELTRRHTRRRFVVPLAWICRLAAKQVPSAFRECWPLFRVLFRSSAARRAGIGTILAIPFDAKAGYSPAEAAGRHALVTAALCFTPNTVVIGLKTDPGHLLLHQLVQTDKPPGGGDPVWPV